MRIANNDDMSLGHRSQMHLQKWSYYIYSYEETEFQVLRC